ncbi:cell wall-active antibiotics response protein [Paenibacillus sp. SZ31]|uniref:cell wall-active antibiotics response protein LiaF n=1 Tax=Paenibacillus sp. SZ31 TaxID=2725555 RepID=UPI00146B43BA|nr:cell wall-active antibiotics response protein LiaF [Paenibacillus sp. SZ31]NMI02926.1 cell wall-active antibiotics response protein [Paenibacillus sp. SZ31]
MKRSTRDRWWVGIPLIAIGAMILFRQLGYDIDVGYIFRTYWPLFLIWWGVKGISEIRRNGGYAFIGPVIVLAIGGYFLARNLGWIDYSMGEFIRYLIPVMLIGGGLFVLIGPRRRDRKHHDKMQPPPAPEQPYKPLSPEDLEMPSSFDEQFEKTFGKPKQEQKNDSYGSFNTAKENPASYEHQQYQKHNAHGSTQKKYEKYDDNDQYDDSSYYGGGGNTINKSAFIGDLYMGQEVFSLKPMNISAFIGDTVIDLTKAQIPYGETKIVISSFIGDVKVFVPEDMDLGVTVTTNSFIGDMSLLNQKRGGFLSSAQAETAHYHEASKKVRIIVSVFIGDVKVNKVG